MHIATSGFSYDHWHAPGSFYEGVPKSGELEFYCRQFDCSELNATFYHFFKDEAFVGWRKKAEATGRPSFQWVVKAQQVSCIAGIWTYPACSSPAACPCPQFPSTFATTTSKGGDNIERLRALGKVLPAEGRFAFEFRHSSWFCPEVYAILKEHDWCLVMCHVAPGRDEYPLDACSWGVYLRFHGSAGQYVGRHGAKEMRRWADWCKTRAAEGKECYLAFNNTDGTPPPAIADARELGAAFRANGVFEHDMRFQLPEETVAAARALDEPQPYLVRDVEECPYFCVPADGVRCRGCRWDEETGCCYRPDCDALFTPRALRQQQREWVRDPRPQLIVTAGPERSGSTWLYNAVRLLFQHARKPLDAYWLKRVTDAALDARGAGCPGAPHVLVKTHAWSEAWDLRRATHVFVTHRDLWQARSRVLASYRRMTWECDIPDDCEPASPDPPLGMPAPPGVVPLLPESEGSCTLGHSGRESVPSAWRPTGCMPCLCADDVAEVDIAFEDIIARPEALLEDLANRMGLHGLVDIKKIWPSHISTPYMEARSTAAAFGGGCAGGGAPGERLSDAQLAALEPATPTSRARLEEEATTRLLERFPEYFQCYGYAL
eukprot:scaffold3.g6454.t1